jgi:PAS domain S-box-containing protein
MSPAKQLIEQELAMLRSLRAIDHTSEGYRLSDLEGNILDANNAYSKMTGYTVEELKQMHISQLAIHESKDEVKARIEKIRVNGQDRFESCHRHKDGHLIDVEVSATYIPEIQQIFIFSHDVTEIKKQCRLFSQLISALSHAKEQVFQLDENAHFLYVNDEICKSFRYTREELLDGMTIFDISTSMTKERWMQHWQALNENESETFQYNERTKDGRELSVEIIANFSNLDGSRLALGLVRDISHHKLYSSGNSYPLIHKS